MAKRSPSTPSLPPDHARYLDRFTFAEVYAAQELMQMSRSAGDDHLKAEEDVNVLIPKQAPMQPPPEGVPLDKPEGGAEEEKEEEEDEWRPLWRVKDRYRLLSDIYAETEPVAGGCGPSPAAGPSAAPKKNRKRTGRKGGKSRK